MIWPIQVEEEEEEEEECKLSAIFRAGQRGKEGQLFPCLT
jgi:hypothetical protein